MQLLSVNLGRAEDVRGAKKPYLSGIAKRPTDTTVSITTLGLTGDVVCDDRYHGGEDQAVYL